jgi:class III poly(R)-hydroxyalkanoic acid synthase PhaE subunit
MSEKNDKTKTQNEPFMDWEEITQNFWSPIMKQWSHFYDHAENQDEPMLKGRVAESLKSNLKMWQTMVTALSGPDTLEQFQKATDMTPDLALGFAQTCLQSLNGLQTQAIDWIQKRGENLSEADIQELDRELLKNWRETYEQEFSRYLKIPQIGLNRLYQERGLNAVDKMNSFQLELSGFLQILYMPIEKSLKALQDEMTKMAETGSIDERSKTYYNLWVKSMEGHYMELFQQEDYSEAMHKTLFTLHEFSKAKNEVINDVLKQLNIPNNIDFDELSKEIYLLKKRVRALERKQVS